MQLIVFNRILSTINRRMEAFCLRAAYLLGGRPIIAGETGREIYFKRDRNGLPLLLKLEMLITFYKHDEGYHSAFEGMRKPIKRANATKRKTREEFVAYRKLEQMIVECWDAACGFMQDTIDAHDFGVIRELEKEQIFGFLTTSVDPEKGGGDEIKASDLMQLYIVEEKESQMEGIYSTPELSFLGSEFLSPEYAKPTLFSAADGEAASHTAIYLQHCFTLPPINTLSAAELQAVRMVLQGAGGSAFCKAVDEWCEACYDNEPPANRISLFQKWVLPAAAGLQGAIESNAILQLCRRQNSGVAPVEIWMGEIPVLELWAFYRQYEILTDATWQKLQAQKDDPQYCEQRWPVMLLKCDESLMHAERVDEEKSAKKYLFVE